MESLEILQDDVTAPAVVQLLHAHRASMFAHSPPECVHALSVDDLRHPSITLWTAWHSGQLLGCGALKALELGHGELKSMRTASTHLRQGVAAALLRHIVAQARARGYQRLSLETGTTPRFDPARRLYERHGFTYTTPFANYAQDPYSVFMTLPL